MRQANRGGWGAWAWLATATAASGLLGCGDVQNLGERTGGPTSCFGGDSVVLPGDGGTRVDSGCAVVNENSGGDSVYWPDASETIPSTGTGTSTTTGTGTGSGFTTEDAGSTTTSGSGVVVSPASCKDACSSAAVLGCGLDGFVASDECELLCSNSLTQGELDCLSNASCDSFLGHLAAETTFCGIAIHDEPVSTLSCTNDCSDVIGACNPAFYVGSTCQDLCASAPTLAEMACLQTLTCNALGAALVAGTSFCGFPAFADGG